MTSRTKLLLALIVPVLVLVASSYVLLRQAQIASTAARDYETAKERITELETEKATLTETLDGLMIELADSQATELEQAGLLQDCQSELNQLKRERDSVARCVLSIGEVDPVLDCIEIVSRSRESIDISGWTVSDGEGEYVFPAGTMIEPFGVVQVCADVYNPARSQDGLFLLQDGDQVFLHDAEGDLCAQTEW